MKRLIKKTHLKVMPWKNRLGVTSEIGIFPEGSDFTKNEFGWRLSTAQILTKNSFSPFPGYDRILTVLSGEGLRLNQLKLKSLEVVDFQGEEEIQCELLHGSVEDLNLICRRGQFRGEMRVLEVGDEMELSFDKGVHFIKAVTGRVSVDWSTLDNEDILRLEAGDGCVIESLEFGSQILIASVFEL